MDFSKLFKKMPKKIQKSEKLVIYLIRLSKIIHKANKKSEKPNQLMNFIFKYTNISVKGSYRLNQLLYVELLKFVHNVCIKYDLDYCLTYGTLLGAIRHEGFIPWDDDLDIMMMRKDYNKLIEILPHEIEKYSILKENCGLTLLTNIEENYFKGFRSIYDVELGHDDYFKQPHMGKSLFLQIGWLKPLVRVDIFPFDYIKEDSIDYYNKNYLGHKYYFRELYNENDFSLKKEFNERYEKLGLTTEETNFIAEPIDGTCFDDFGPFKSEYVFPMKNITFEGETFKCPNKPHELLKLWYGENYMDLPNDLRIHYYTDYNLTLFNSKKEMDDSYNKAIEYLKEINNNFQ